MKTISKTLSVLVLSVILLACGPDEDVYLTDPTVQTIIATSSDINLAFQDYEGTISLEVVLANNGPQNFTSVAGAQEIVLWRISNTGEETVVSRMPFNEVAVGETVSLTTSNIPWNTTNEFPPSFKATIVYDPDIFIDSINENNDADLTNNEDTITGEMINTSI